MKTRKLMLGMLAAMIAVSCANAYDQSQKEKCFKNPDKAAWVESKGACIPVNPCKNDKFEVYCDRRFAEIHVPTPTDAGKLIDLYAKRHNLNCTGKKDVDSAFFGQDFVPCIGNDYVMFEFNGISNSNSPGRVGYKRGQCMALDGKVRSGGCYGISESDCKNIMGVEKLTKDKNGEYYCSMLGIGIDNGLSFDVPE